MRSATDSGWDLDTAPDHDTRKTVEIPRGELGVLVRRARAERPTLEIPREMLEALRRASR